MQSKGRIVIESISPPKLAPYHFFLATHIPPKHWSADVEKDLLVPVFDKCRAKFGACKTTVFFDPELVHHDHTESHQQQQQRPRKQPYVWAFAKEWNGIGKAFRVKEDGNNDDLFNDTNRIDLGSGDVYFVCGHGTRDTRCGDAGPGICDEINRLKSSSTPPQRRYSAYLCSHIGGHAFAGNVIKFPANEYYCKVTALNVHEIVHGLNLQTVKFKGFGW